MKEVNYMWYKLGDSLLNTFKDKPVFIKVLVAMNLFWVHSSSCSNMSKPLHELRFHV